VRDITETRHTRTCGDARSTGMYHIKYHIIKKQIMNDIIKYQKMLFFSVKKGLDYELLRVMCCISSGNYYIRCISHVYILRRLIFFWSFDVFYDLLMCFVMLVMCFDAQELAGWSFWQNRKGIVSQFHWFSKLVTIWNSVCISIDFRGFFINFLCDLFHFLSFYVSEHEPMPTITAPSMSSCLYVYTYHNKMIQKSWSWRGKYIKIKSRLIKLKLKMLMLWSHTWIILRELNL